VQVLILEKLQLFVVLWASKSNIYLIKIVLYFIFLGPWLENAFDIFHFWFRFFFWYILFPFSRRCESKLSQPIVFLKQHLNEYDSHVIDMWYLLYLLSTVLGCHVIDMWYLLLYLFLLSTVLGCHVIDMWYLLLYLLSTVLGCHVIDMWYLLLYLMTTVWAGQIYDKS
jgi:hypothetical protein